LLQRQHRAVTISFVRTSPGRLDGQKRGVRVACGARVASWLGPRLRAVRHRCTVTRWFGPVAAHWCCGCRRPLRG